MVIQESVYLASLSGALGTLGSIFGKLAGLYEFSNWWSAMGKLVLLAAMVTVNTIGCTLFARALANSGSTLPVTVVSSTINYFCSAMLGILVFGESTSIYWWCGTSLMLLGLMVMSHSPAPEHKEAKEE